MSSATQGLRYQHEYEAALGRLLVRFNDLEIMAGEALEGTLRQLRLLHLYRTDDYYIQKVDRLELALKALTASGPSTWTYSPVSVRNERDPSVDDWALPTLNPTGLVPLNRAITCCKSNVTH